MTEAVWEEVRCFEKDHYYGCAYLFSLWLPALFNYHILKGSGLDACLFFFVVIPFYPLLAFSVRVIGLFNPGDNWSKLESRFALLEGAWEARFQFMMTLYIVFSRADRGMSYFQMVALALSMASFSLTGVNNARKKQTSLEWGGEFRRGIYYLPSIFWKNVSRLAGISLLATLLQWWTLLLLLVMLLLGYALQSIYLRPENPDMEVQVSVAPGIQMTQRNFKDALIDMAAWWALTLTLSLLTLLVYPSLEFPGLAWHGLTIGENIHLSTLLSLYYIYSITFGATILYHFFFVVYFLLPFREANIEVELHWISVYHIRIS